MSRATLLSRTNSSRRPSTAVLLPNAAPLSDPARQAQFKSDLREVVQILIARHKNATAANKNNRIWFWGTQRTIRQPQFAADRLQRGR